MEENMEEAPKDPGSANSSGESRKSKNLKEATQHLKEEALRRFQINHKASLENHEKTVKEELEAVQGLSSPAKDESNNIESKAEEIGDTEEASVETKRPDEDIEKEGVSGGFENTVDSGDDLADKNVSADGICPDSDVETPSDNVKDREVGEQEDNLEINSNRAEHTGQDLPEGETIVPAEDSIENTLSSSKPTGGEDAPGTDSHSAHDSQGPEGEAGPTEGQEKEEQAESAPKLDKVANENPVPAMDEQEVGNDALPVGDNADGKPADQEAASKENTALDNDGQKSSEAAAKDTKSSPQEATEKAEKEKPVDSEKTTVASEETVADKPTENKENPDVDSNKTDAEEPQGIQTTEDGGPAGVDTKDVSQAPSKESADGGEKAVETTEKEEVSTKQGPTNDEEQAKESQPIADNVGTTAGAEKDADGAAGVEPATEGTGTKSKDPENAPAESTSDGQEPDAKDSSAPSEETTEINPANSEQKAEDNEQLTSGGEGKLAEGGSKPTEDEPKQADGDQKPDDGQSKLDPKPTEQAAGGEPDQPKAVSFEEKTEKAAQKEEEGTEKQESVDGLDPATRGDELEVHSESPVDPDDTSKIPDNFYYNVEEYISRPRIMADSGLPQDILTLHHSFGYDCHKRANLHMMDENTAVFAAGNVVELLDLRAKEQKYLRSTSGGGIGALAVHPSHKYFAVAEKGLAPNIIIYEYPSLKLYRILRGGTQAAYAYVDYSPDGKLLASVGGDPDYMLTLWDWKNEKIVLRSKAFSQDVFRVTFSSELQGQLTSSGTGHIRFWKMAKTFTGLKLQGLLGKFGKTEISDIEGYVELPDGKVLSGSEWGNMLLWDGGLIKVEIARKGRKPCHNGLIQQIIMDEGELMTIGTDGYIRVWDFETVDTADVTDDTALFEMEPMNELKVGNDVQLKSIVKTVNAEEPTMWYAQDANGGIWKLDLSFSFTSTAPEKLVSYHSGVITGCDTSPVSHLVATTGEDKTVRVYDYMAKQVLCESRFAQKGTSLLWLPKIVDTRGSTILVGFGDGVVRALTLQTVDEVDIHGRKKENVSELVLKQAFKPHNKSVISMAVDSKGDILATGSEDKTVFFFNIGKNFEPTGFVRIPSAVTHLSWSPAHNKRSTLLICCKGGEVIEYVSPDEGTFDTSKTFEITGLSNRIHKFKSIKSRLRHEEEMARKTQELEEKKKKEEEERRMRIERGLETESENGDEEPTEEEDEEEWSPYIPAEPSPILHALYDNSDENNVWLSAGSFDAGYLYEAQLLSEEDKKSLMAEKLYEPTRNLPMIDADDTPVTVLKYSEDRKRLIMGMADGSVRIHPLASGDIGEMGPYWILNVHDNHYGSITHIASSFDQKFLFTVGADGNFFTFQVMAQEKVEAETLENKAKIPSAKKQDSEVRIDDIDDPNAYSIEDAKQKSEHDKMLRLAEEKKAGVKRSIETLRKDFRKLLEKNQELPAHLHLSRKEFEMDPEIKQELERQKQEKIDLVRKEMAWEEEKFSIALEKLRTRFKDIVECERIVVKAFMTKHEVSSFRSTKLPDDFYVAKSEMQNRKNTMLSNKEGEFGSRQATQELLKGQTSVLDGQGEGTGAGVENKEGAKVVTSLKGSMGERINKALAKVEDKKRKRQVRRQQWEELFSSKPDDNYEDPADVLAIKEAQENMGDYKLKSADDYVVPDHLRMNTDKARSKLLVLKDLIHQCKYDFNQRLLSLRDTKIHIIEEIRDIVRQLAKVQADMLPEQVKPLPDIPEMHSEELPEKKFEYTCETLLKFKKNMSKVKDADSKGGGGGGFGGFGGAPATQSEASTPVASATRRSPASGIGDTEGTSPKQPEAHESELERKIKRAEEIRALYVRDQLLKRVDDLLKNFDAELRVLRHEKFKMDVDLKNADLRQVTLFEELLLLKDFEKRENVLAAKVNSKMQEKQDMQAKVIEVQNNIAIKKKDIEKLQEKEKTLNSQFQISLGENNKFGDYLTKVFKKKIKRSKKKATDGDGSDDESDEESEDDSDWSESEEESESEEGGYDLDACPSGCDQTLYDNTCTLREKRLDIEEALAEEKKNRDTLTKELDALSKKVKIIDNALRQAENELEAFQLEKQRKLNELDVVVTLKLHQIQYMINGVLPQDLTPTLVFDAHGVTRLVARIKELELEKTSQKKQQKEARKKHIQLNKDRKLFESRIGQMEDVCNKMMLQKFGRIVDLERLETVTVNRNIEELKEKLRNSEITCSSELKKWDEKLREASDYITQLVRENTQRLEQLNMLLCERKDFETALDSRQKNLGGEFTGVRKSDVHERQRLIQLVHLQAQEVEALKEEITLLSRKGGHILPPAQPPMPQSATAGPRQTMMPTA